MALELWLKARIRKRDHDIRDEINRRNLSFGEMADMVREGVRLVLFKKGKDQVSSSDPIFASLNEKIPDVPEDAEASVDRLFSF